MRYSDLPAIIACYWFSPALRHLAAKMAFHSDDTYIRSNKKVVGAFFHANSWEDRPIIVPISFFFHEDNLKKTHRVSQKSSFP